MPSSCHCKKAFAFQGFSVVGDDVPVAGTVRGQDLAGAAAGAAESVLLDVAVVWIGDNLQPEDVFSRDQLDEWAYDNDFYRKD